MGNIRHAMYAGTWYPAEEKEIDKFINHKSDKIEVMGCVCPHAGWVYSGKTAGMVMSKIKSAEVFIILSPKHRGAYKSAVSIMKEGQWDTPLGRLEIESDIASNILNFSKVLKNDPMAHTEEHSIEVITPFIKHLFPESKFVPISFFDYSWETCTDLGTSIIQTINKLKAKKVVIIASSDMSHHLPADTAKKMDQFAIDKILELNPKELLDVVEEKNVSMCGAGPVASMLIAVKELGAVKSELVDYSTSGDAEKNYFDVVSYAGIIVY